jgi:hypothetical protein
MLLKMETLPRRIHHHGRRFFPRNFLAEELLAEERWCILRPDDFSPENGKFFSNKSLLILFC